MPFNGGRIGELVITPHTVDGDTIEHWELDADLIPDIDNTNNDFDTGLYHPAYLPGSTSKTCCATSPDTVGAITGATNSNLRQTGAFTVAACVYQGKRAGGGTNRVLWRYAPFDQTGDGTEANNTFYDLAYEPSGNLRVFWENSTGTNNVASTTVNLPEFQWSHVVWTRNSDNVTGRVYVNGVYEEYTQSNAATGATNGVLNLGNGNLGDPSYLAFYSLIVKDIAVTKAQVDAMRKQVGLF